MQGLSDIDILPEAVCPSIRSIATTTKTKKKGEEIIENYDINNTEKTL